MQDTSKTHFGFKTIDVQDKTARVRGVFDSVASRYDLMNDVMSLGTHRLWKREFLTSLNLRDGQQVLDLAGGTGDIAFLMSRRAELCVSICDINESMLTVGRERAKQEAPHADSFDWVTGNAESLPFPDHSFDRVSIAFGIRNVTDIPAALAEIYRVLKPGGLFACLEFSEVKHALLKPIYDRYSFDIIPRFGEWIAQDRESYEYLVESIRRFPNQLQYKRMMQQAGLAQCSYRNLSGGIVAIHKGWKI